MLKVGLIGCGGIGAVHAKCWNSLGEDVQLTAIADLDMQKAKRCAEGSEIRIYQNGFEMLEQEELDVVDICVPTFLHAKYATVAMQYVKNVIIEKPVCLNEVEARQLLEMQAHTGALVQVGHVQRFTNTYVFLKKLVDSGKYGKVVAGNFTRISPRPLWMKGHDDINKTGTMAFDMHIHDVDYIRYLMGGEPDYINSNAVRDKNGVVQHIWSSYHYGDTVLTVEGSWDYPAEVPFCECYRVRLEKAAVILDSEGVVYLYTEDGKTEVFHLEDRIEMDMGINVSDMRPYLSEIQYFVDTIVKKNYQGAASLNEAVASFRLIKKELELVGLDVK
ncbi:MAG: Gfo/Idh/MocA family oxidoreductase [Lachnospiraceae bacterium]|nr:Gfo/Idh/MocA family oxidoreductase [Lachnospiraceae bacterium]